MLRKLSTLFLMLGAVLGLSGFATPVAAAAEEGNPWYMWLLILGALALFVIFFLWWWVRSHDDDEDDDVQVPIRAESIPVEPVAEVEETAPEAPLEPDDLKKIEGIGPKISSVLQAGGINTFTQLADLNAEQIEAILTEADPNLTRLAVPDSWPKQAELAAEGQWDALEQFQDQLKGGKHV